MTYDSRPDTIKHINEVRRNLWKVISELQDRSWDHDLSKLESPEVEMFDEFTPKLAETEYGTPRYKALLEAMGPALRHHYDRNRHHPEHFADGIADMNLVDVIEMLCDWEAAGRRHESPDIHRSIEHNRERFGYGDELARLLHNTADALWPRGSGHSPAGHSPASDSGRITGAAS